jgi:multidrug efflux pump subunit AcrA (membrane-fusion protein)
MAITDETMADTPGTDDKSKPDGEKPPHHRHSPAYWIMFGLLVVGIAALVYFFAWLPRNKREQELERQTRQDVQATPRVRVLRVERSSAAAHLQVPGTTLAYLEASVYARASGYLSRRLVDIGDRVREGQLLATIDAPDLDKQVAQAVSNVEQSRSSLAQMEAQLHLQSLNNDRYKVLVAKGVFSRQQGDQQEADFRVAEANVAAARNTVQANLDNLERLRVLQQYERVTAPFNGVITARNVDVGDLISATGSGLGPSSSPSGLSFAGAQGNNSGSSGSVSSNVSPSTGGSQGGAMFGIANVDPLRILVSVPEAYAGLVRVGSRANLFFQELPQEHYQGRVTRTSASIDSNTRTLLVEVQVRNPSGKLMSGMYAVVDFVELAARPPLMVPGAAIVVRDGKSMLAVVDSDNTVHFHPIQIGRDFGNETEVASGLNPGESIITIITDQVRDGEKIQPEFEKPAQPQPGGQSDRRPGEEGRYGNQHLSNQSGKALKTTGGKAQDKSQ